MRRIDTYDREQLLTLVKELNSNHICGVCPDKNSMCDGLVPLDHCYSNIVNNLIEEVKEKSISPTIDDVFDLLKAHIRSSTPDNTPLVLTPKYYNILHKHLLQFSSIYKTKVAFIDLYALVIPPGMNHLYLDKKESRKLIDLLLYIKNSKLC